MYEASVVDAAQAIDQMAEVLNYIKSQYGEFHESLETRAQHLEETDSETRQSFRRKMRIIQLIRSDGLELAQDISLVIAELDQSHDLLIQTLGDVLLCCDIDNRIHMASFRQLVEAIDDHRVGIDGLIAAGTAVVDLMTQSGDSHSIDRAISNLNDVLKRINAVYTRMMHLSEYFS